MKSIIEKPYILCNIKTEEATMAPGIAITLLLIKGEKGKKQSLKYNEENLGRSI